MEIFLSLINSILGYLSKKLIDWGFKKSADRKSLEEKKDELQKDSCRLISGIWICQYKYPRMDDSINQKVSTIEKQVVRFEQENNNVTGVSLFAIAHPEDFEGIITKDLYFTGMYFNQKNYHSYHGAFQFILSNSHNRMLGKWVGFNREANDVNAEEWRWLQVDDNPEISKEKEHEYIARVQNEDLFSIVNFL
jgi:hypothetical protein